MRSMQDIFLNKLRKDKVPCTIIVTNGFQIKNACIVSFDNFAIMIDADGSQMMLFKHAISSITPMHTIDLSDDGEEK